MGTLWPYCGIEKVDLEAVIGNPGSQVLWQHLDDQAHVALAAGVFDVAGVLLRELADVLPRFFTAGDVDDFAADEEVVVRTVRVDDGDGDARVATNVARLRASVAGIDDYVGAVVVDPRRASPGVSHPS